MAYVPQVYWFNRVFTDNFCTSQKIKDCQSYENNARLTIFIHLNLCKFALKSINLLIQVQIDCYIDRHRNHFERVVQDGFPAQRYHHDS